MTAAIRLFVAAFITTLLAGAAGANDDLPPQGGPLGNAIIIGGPTEKEAVIGGTTDEVLYESAIYNHFMVGLPSISKAEDERFRLARPVTLLIDVAASGIVARVTVVSGPKDPEFQQMMTKVVGKQLPPLPYSLGSSEQVELTIK